MSKNIEEKRSFECFANQTKLVKQKRLLNLSTSVSSLTPNGLLSVTGQVLLEEISALLRPPFSLHFELLVPDLEQKGILVKNLSNAKKTNENNPRAVFHSLVLVGMVESTA